MQNQNTKGMCAYLCSYGPSFRSTVIYFMVKIGIGEIAVEDVLAAIMLVTFTILVRDQGRFAKIQAWRPYASSGASL
jgi:hypothetical protein